MRLMAEPPAETFASNGDSPHHAAERGDTLSVVLQALGALPPVQQEVVRLKFQHSLSYKEIGAVLNLTATNVGFILHGALKTLRTQLNDAPAARQKN